MANTALEVKNLSKIYGDYQAVRGISFSIPCGSVVGLLGPNGAGKTTTIQMLLGITEMTSGEIRYFDQDFRTHRQSCLSRINFTSAYNSLQGKITVLENLRSFACLYSIKNAKKKINELAEFFEIVDLFHQRFRSLSAGQRAKVNLVKALLNDPELILMDEPTASLDPDIRERTLSLIEELRATRNLSILFTSHNMDEVTRICDEVIFLDQGTIVRQDTPQNLAAQLHKTQLVVSLSGNSELLQSQLNAMGEECTLEAGTRLVIFTDSVEIPRLLSFINSADGIAIVDIDIRKPTLDGVFLDLARKKADVLVTN